MSFSGVYGHGCVEVQSDGSNTHFEKIYCMIFFQHETQTLKASLQMLSYVFNVLMGVCMSHFRIIPNDSKTTCTSE